MSLGATMAWPGGTFVQCEAVDHRWCVDRRCVESAGHDGPHVRETDRGNLVYWGEPR